MKLEYLVLRKYHTLLLLIILVISLLYCTSVLTPCFPSDYTVPAERGGQERWVGETRTRLAEFCSSRMSLQKMRYCGGCSIMGRKRHSRKSSTRHSRFVGTLLSSAAAEMSRLFQYIKLVLQILSLYLVNRQGSLAKVGTFSS